MKLRFDGTCTRMPASSRMIATVMPFSCSSMSFAIAGYVRERRAAALAS